MGNVLGPLSLSCGLMVRLQLQVLEAVNSDELVEAFDVGVYLRPAVGAFSFLVGIVLDQLHHLMTAELR